MAIEINGMAHVILTVSRFKVAREFYRRLLPEFGIKWCSTATGSSTASARGLRSASSQAIRRWLASASSSSGSARTISACEISACELTHGHRERMRSGRDGGRTAGRCRCNSQPSGMPSVDRGRPQAKQKDLVCFGSRKHLRKLMTSLVKYCSLKLIKGKK